MQTKEATAYFHCLYLLLFFLLVIHKLFTLQEEGKGERGQDHQSWKSNVKFHVSR